MNRDQIELLMNLLRIELTVMNTSSVELAVVRAEAITAQLAYLQNVLNKLPIPQPPGWPIIAETLKPT